MSHSSDDGGEFFHIGISRTDYSLIMNSSAKTKIQEREGQQVQSFVTPKKPTKRSKANGPTAPFFYSEKMKTIAKQINEQSQRRFTQKIHRGVEKWVLRSELKIISEPLKLVVPSSIDKPRLTLAELQMQIDEVHNRCAGLVQTNQLLKQGIVEIGRANEELQEEKRKYMREIEVYDRKIQSIEMIENYNDTIVCENEKFQQDIRYFTANNKQFDQEMRAVCEEIGRFEEWMAQIQAEIDQERRINEYLCGEIDAKEEKLREIADRKVPNMKEMTKTLFLVGILEEQIYVLNLQKKEKGSLEHQGQSKYPRPYRQASQKKLSKGELSQKFANRQVYIQGNTEEAILQRIFAAIFMHCRTLTLNNPVGLMNRVSFFSEEFKEVYNFSDFELYFESLVNSIKKGGKRCQKMKIEGSNSGDKTKIAKSLTILTDEQYLPYILWVVDLFDRGGQPCLIAGSLKVYLFVIPTHRYPQPDCQKLQSETNSLQFIFSKPQQTSERHP